LHVLYDLESRTVVSLRVTEGSRHDSPVFRDLIGDVAELECLLADSGYLARRNVQLVVDKGGLPFIKLKENVNRSSKPRGILLGRIWFGFSWIIRGSFGVFTGLEY